MSVVERFISRLAGKRAGFEEIEAEPGGRRNILDRGRGAIFSALPRTSSPGILGNCGR